jgi:hypothetical protein
VQFDRRLQQTADKVDPKKLDVLVVAVGTSKFIAPAFTVGKGAIAVLGIADYMGVTDERIGGFLSKPEQSLQAEWSGEGHSCCADDALINSLVEHPNAKAAKLGRHHVMALRFYTGHGYNAMNPPLRAGTKPHPLPTTTYFITGKWARQRVGSK